MPDLSGLIPKINIDIGPQHRERMQPHPRYRNNGDGRSDRPRYRERDVPEDAPAAEAPAGPDPTMTTSVCTTDVSGTSVSAIPSLNSAMVAAPFGS